MARVRRQIRARALTRLDELDPLEVALAIECHAHAIRCNVHELAQAMLEALQAAQLLHAQRQGHGRVVAVRGGSTPRHEEERLRGVQSVCCRQHLDAHSALVIEFHVLERLPRIAMHLTQRKVLA
jgi:DNA-binding LacI/PurR family transcriptional regulator